MVLQGQALPVKWDEYGYFLRAREILADVSAYRDVLRAPVYPFFLAFIFQIFGELRFSVGILQALISTVMVASIFTLTRGLFARTSIALVAALLTALYLEFLTLTRLLMSETLFMALTAFGVTILFYAWRHRRAREMIFAGIILALAALTRELFSYFAVLVLPLWIVLASYKQPRLMVRQLGALLLGLALVFTPWVARNYSIEQRFILATTHSEIDLLRDNWRIELRAQNLPLNDASGSMAKRVRKALAQVPKNERSMYVLARTAQTILNYPTEWTADKFSRLRNLWRPFVLEARVVRLENVEQPWRGWLQQIVSYSAVALLLLGTFGILAARDDAPKLLIAFYILYSLAIFIVTHFLPRFRLPLLIFLIPYAAYTLVQISLWLRAPSLQIFRSHRVRAFSVLVVLGSFIYLTRI